MAMIDRINVPIERLCAKHAEKEVFRSEHSSISEEIHLGIRPLTSPHG